MLSTKGAVQFYIVSILLILIAGFVSILVYSEVSYGILSNQGNSACTLRNAFQNLYTGDDLAEQVLDAGNSNCKVISETLRPPDITNTNLMFNICKDLIKYYQGNYDLAINDKNFPDLCLSYALVDRSNSCWNTYLKGNAKFSGECNRICLANGFRSYELKDISGDIYIPYTENYDIKLSNKPINQYSLKFQEIGALIDVSNSEVKITESEENGLIKINYEKSLSVKDDDLYLIVIIDQSISSNTISEMISFYSSINEFGPKNVLNNPENTYTSNDQIILGFVESTNLNLLESGSKTIAFKKGIYPLYVLGATIGETGFGEVELSENSIYIERRGQC